MEQRGTLYSSSASRSQTDTVRIIWTHSGSTRKYHFNYTHAHKSNSCLSWAGASLCRIKIASPVPSWEVSLDWGGCNGLYRSTKHLGLLGQTGAKTAWLFPPSPINTCPACPIDHMDLCFPMERLWTMVSAGTRKKRWETLHESAKGKFVFI